MSLVLLLLAGVAAMGCSSPGATRASPSERDCAKCHAAIATEWRGSRHAVAFTNDVFVREFSERRTAWCVTCHAPNVADPVSVRDDDPAALAGVDCVACHRRDGVIVARSRSPSSPHATRVDPAFGSPAFCAGCHEFEFPHLDGRGLRIGDTGVAMQETVSQFETSPAARRGKDCGSCHQRTPAGHLFPGSHDLAMLRRAVSVSACRDGDELAIAVRNRRAGHNVPGGGVHRHMVIRAWRSAAPERMFEGYIGRRFLPAASGGKNKVFDSTIEPESSRTWRLPLDALGGPGDHPVNLELRYVYVEEGSGPVEEIEQLSRTIHRTSLRPTPDNDCQPATPEPS